MKRPTKFSIMRHNRHCMERVRAKVQEDSDDAYADRLIAEMHRTSEELAMEAGYVAALDGGPPIRVWSVADILKAKRPAPRRWWWPLNWGN